MKPLFLVLLAVALLWGGAQNVYTSLRNRSPTELSCAELERDPPTAEWLSLRDCEYDIENLASEALLGAAVLELYVPLRPLGDGAGGPSRIVLKTSDAELVKVVQKLLSASGSPEALTHARSLAELRAPARITGLVKFGIELKSAEVKKLKELNPNLPEGFLLLEQGEHPLPLAFSVVLFGLGVLLSVWLGRRLFARGRPA
jgi:hypothetical protein